MIQRQPDPQAEPEHRKTSLADAYTGQDAVALPAASILTQAPASDPPPVLPDLHSSRDLLDDARRDRPEPTQSVSLRISAKLFFDPETDSAYVQLPGWGNPFLVKVGGKAFNAIAAQHLRSLGEGAGKKQIAELAEELEAKAVLSGERASVACRVAQTPDGLRVVALLDDANRHVVIGPNSVTVLETGSPALIARSHTTLPLPVPADRGDFQRLKEFVNLPPREFILWIGWVTYVLAHAKVPGNVFPILGLLGGMGTAKTTLARITKMVVDPDTVSVERMPSNAEGLALLVQGRHVLALDNLRHTKTELSDALCMVATRGTFSKRRLYTDGDVRAFLLHCAVILNGIHAFIQESDLAQRTLLLTLEPIPESQRQSEDQLYARLTEALPGIMRGLFDLIAKILAHLDSAKVERPHRLIGFVRWLAAWEASENMPQPVYQDAFIDVNNECQLETLQEDVLADAVLNFAQKCEDGQWAGTPAELLEALNTVANFGQRGAPRAWPDNPIALSKRLAPLQAALMTQGIAVKFKRGKHRSISISYREGR